MLYLNLVCGGSGLFEYGNNSLLNFTDIGFLILISLLLVYTFFKLKSNQKKWSYEEPINQEKHAFNFVLKDVLMQPKSTQNIEVNFLANQYTNFSVFVNKVLRFGLKFLHFLAIILALISIALAIDFLIFFFL